MPEFNDQSVYNKHQVSCDCEGDCSCSKNDDCGCCPPGLIGVKDCNGDVSCLTPEDAVALENGNHVPATGYVKLYDPVTNDYLGDVTPADAIAYIAAIDPNIDAPVDSGVNFNPTTNEAATLGVAAPAGTSTVAVDFGVDRVNCNEEVIVALAAGTPAGITFLGGANTISIPSTESVLPNGIRIDDTIVVGVYNVTVLYSSCGLSKSRVITITVT
jgi:hypothetical protein